MVEKKAYPGTISSVILSIVVMGILLMPFYIANNRDRLRKGEVGYEFVETMCFDITKKSEFESDEFTNFREPCVLIFKWEV